MKKLYLFLVVTAITVISVSAQTDWKKLLKQDLVEFKGTDMLAKEYTLCTWEDGTSVQIMTSAKSPADVMSRDNFVSIYSTYTTLILLTIFEEAELEIPQMTTLDELIGDPDITIHIEMTKNGMQMQVKSEEGVDQETMTWEQVFE